MIYILIAIVTFIYVAYHFMLIDRAMNDDKRNIRSRDVSNVTHYTGATFNRHGRAID